MYSKLCTKCEMVNFEEIYALSAQDMKHHGTAVARHRKDLSANCAFCALVRFICSPKIAAPDNGSLEKNGYHLRVFDSLKMLRLRRRAHRVGSGPNIVLAVVLGPPFGADRGYKDPLKRSNLGISKGVITLRPRLSENILPGPFDYFGRPVKPQVDYELLRSWIGECQASTSGFHKECNSKATWLPNIYVIDCHTRKIVPLKENQEYLALSYVWGSHHQPITEISHNGLALNKLLYEAPKTIEDAIEVVKGLGNQCLWVDRYCIPLGDHKHKAIQNMGLVYDGALATLVAVAGPDSEYGLSGVSRPRPTPQCVEKDFGILRPTLCHMSHHISRSVWVTRGWTYQEAFLSRRCLFFTEDQVYFACRASTCCESVIQSPLSESDPSHEALDPSLMRPGSQISYQITRRKRPELADHLSEYTSRSLSYETDGLNAFKGFLAQDRHCSYWGIPFRVYSLDSRDEIVHVRFIEALFWRIQRRDQARRPHARRPGFPSWCWASVPSQIELWERLVSGNTRSAKAWVEISRDRVLGVDELFKSQADSSAIIPEYSHLLRIQIEIIRIRLKRCDRDDYDFSASLDSDSTKIEIGLVRTDLDPHHATGSCPESEVWDTMITPQRDDMDCAPFGMLLKWTGATAYRIGWVQFSSNQTFRNAQLRSFDLG